MLAFGITVETIALEGFCCQMAFALLNQISFGEHVLL
jgi:hypothetical protein